MSQIMIKYEGHYTSEDKSGVDVKRLITEVNKNFLLTQADRKKMVFEDEKDDTYRVYLEFTTDEPAEEEQVVELRGSIMESIQKDFNISNLKSVADPSINIRRKATAYTARKTEKQKASGSKDGAPKKTASKATKSTESADAE